MQAIFYQINKRSNSTKLPSGGRAFEINLKSPCTIMTRNLRLLPKATPPGTIIAIYPFLAGITGSKTGRIPTGAGLRQ